VLIIFGEFIEIEELTFLAVTTTTTIIFK